MIFESEFLKLQIGKMGKPKMIRLSPYEKWKKSTSSATQIAGKYLY